MHSSEYIELANRTKKSFSLSLTEVETDILHAAIGIAGEAGELIDAVKKYIIYGKPLDGDNIDEEMGDILWYLAIMAKALGTNFEKLMEANIDKLKLRYPEKYTDAAAHARADKVSDKVIENGQG
jgi:NTP pyrophosphatase (non-canonical NTP hydrolase)